MIVNLPKGCLPDVAVTIVSFIEENGQEGYRYHIVGDPTFATILGLLSVVEGNIHGQLKLA